MLIPLPILQKQPRQVYEMVPSPVNPTTVPTTTELAYYYQTLLPVYMPLYRLADIYLLYAEALNATNDLAGALKYLNFVHVRAGLPAYTAVNPLVAKKQPCSMPFCRKGSGN
jgi:hypothetical protein